MSAQPARITPDHPELRLTDAVAHDVDVLVVGVGKGADGPVLIGDDLLAGSDLFGELASLGATGAADEVTKVPTRGAMAATTVLAVGVGAIESSDPTGEQVRRAAGAAAGALAGTAYAATTLSSLDLAATVEGTVLGSYAFTTYKSAAGKAPVTRMDLLVPDATSADAKVTLDRAVAIGTAVATARELVNTPPNDLFPASFAERATALGKTAGVKVEVLDEKALKKGRYGGVLAVGRGSARPPRLVRISYRPAKAKVHVALVGKGITFDSGGLNLKTANMTVMKSDMGGAAACIASVLAIAALKIPVSVTVTTPMAENMISGDAYRPSDIITLRDGSTLEVGDTDAEGRIVLADALNRAAEDSPDRMIEISTLTGAQLIALGPRIIGAMGEPAWRDEVVAAGNEVGEANWAMPLPEELRALIDSPVADLVNVPTERVAGMLVAGRFLGQFVPEELPWVHLDIAGPSFNTAAARDYTPKGGTGAGVRTIIAAVERLAR